MSKSKPYKVQEPEVHRVSEPMAEYCSASTINNFVNSIPQDALSEMIKFAVAEHKAGLCIPHSQIDQIMKERMGWK